MASVNIRVKKIYEDAMIPTQGSEWAAGADLYAYISDNGYGRDIGIAPGQTVMVGTGISMAIPKAYWGGVFARSGLASKQGLAPANCVGVVDPDYRGEVKVALHNHSDEHRLIQHGDRIAQLVIVPLPRATYKEVRELDDTARGDGGFGHTGA